MNAMEQTIQEAPGHDAACVRRLRVISPSGPRTFALGEPGAHVLGRGGEWCSGDLPCLVNEPAISRRHAALNVGATVQLEDLGSTNGTWYRGRRLGPGERVDLLPGEVFGLGTEVLCVFEAPLSAEAPSRVWTFTYFEGRLADECRMAAARRASFEVLHVRANGEADGAFASRLAQAAGAGAVVAVDVPGRFVVLRGASGAETAADAAQRLQDALRALDAGARVGAARFPADGQTPDQLLAAARASTRSSVPVAPSDLVVENGRMRDLYSLIDRVARGSINVLILGETGVGKEVIARQVHARSQRAKGAFEAINCAALPESLVEGELFGYVRGAFSGAQADRQGIFERANGGTVFLDEVGEIPAAVQVKLLRVLETRSVRRLGGAAEVRFDARIIAATNRELEREVEAGDASRFRADLYFRLNGFPITIPPLRERVDEVEPLALTFLAAICARDGIDEVPELSREALDALRAYPWPGNIRELRNVIERAVFLATDGLIAPEHLPEKIVLRPRSAARPPRLPAPPAPPAEWPRLADVLDATEAEHVRRTLERCGWNQTRAAAQLDVSRMTLITKMKKYGLRQPGR